MKSAIEKHNDPANYEEYLRNYKEIGVNRKPGRGEICPSAGCIHKIAKWCHLGLQGRRLFGLIGHSIPIHRIVIGNCEEYSLSSQAILERIFNRIVISKNESEHFKKILNEQHIDGLMHLFRKEPLERDRIDFVEDFQKNEFMRSRVNDQTEFDDGSRMQRRPVGVSIVAWKNGNMLVNFFFSPFLSRSHFLLIFLIQFLFFITFPMFSLNLSLSLVSLVVSSQFLFFIFLYFCL